MNKNDLLEKGVSFETDKACRPLKGYTVRVKVDYRAVRFSLRRELADYFKGKRVFPIVYGDRLYFMRTDGSEGYKANVNGNSCAFAVGGGGPNGRDLSALEKFDGEYKTVHFDDESALYYIDRKEGK